MAIPEGQKQILRDTVRWVRQSRTQGSPPANSKASPYSRYIQITGVNAAAAENVLHVYKHQLVYFDTATWAWLPADPAVTGDFAVPIQLTPGLEKFKGLVYPVVSDAVSEENGVLLFDAGDACIDVQLTSASQLSGYTGRWLYGWKRMILDVEGRWKEPAPELMATGSAYNALEANNSGSGVQGSGDNIADFPAGSGIAIKPLGVGSGSGTHRLYAKANCEFGVEYVFYAPNNPGGSCD